MANTSSQPVKEVPGFARVGQAVRRGVLAALNPIFGTPENPTKLGRAVALAEEASQHGLMAGPATGMMRYAVRAPLTVDPRFLGSGTVPLPNVQRSASKAFVPRSGFSSMPRDIQAVREGLTEGKKVLVPKSMFSNAPGDFAYLDDVGNVVIPDSTAGLIKKYNDRYVRVAPPGSKTPRAVSMTEVEKMARNVDRADAPYDLKQANLRALSDAVNPYWQYWMYERDIASLNKTLAKYRAPKDRVTGDPVFYKNRENLSFDVLSAEAAQTVLSNLPGTGYRLSTPGFGAVDYMPNHVSAMSRDRFIRPGSKLYDLYNDGYLPYQSATFLGAERKVNGRTVRPIMRVTDHHEFLDVPDGFTLSRVANRDFPRVYHAGREVPSYRFTPVDPGDIEAVYRLDGRPVVPSTGRYTASIAVQQAGKGGDSPHRNFRNFLASDKVPESIFGYPVVQREEDYTPEDLEFFRKNPKAAGFYDLEDGDETNAAGFYDLEDGDEADAAEKGGEAQPVLAFYGKRPDGTWKGTGWLGELKLPGGGVAGEYSVGVGIDGKETLIPTLTPNLSKDEIRLMVNDIIPGGKKVPDAILSKAVAHARARLAEGRSPFKNDGMDPRRGFAMGFEQPLDLRDGFVYPKKDADGQITAGGYRYFYGRSDGIRKAHSNLNRMTYAQWLRNADMADAEYASFAEGLAKSWGDSPDGAAAGFLFDVAFNSKNYQRLLSKEGSPRLYATMEQLRPVYKGKAGALALLSESDTYGTNRNRSMARGRLILSELQRSGDPGLRKIAEAYDTAYETAPGTGKTADAREQGRHEEGLKAVRKLLGIERK